MRWAALVVIVAGCGGSSPNVPYPDPVGTGGSEATGGTVAASGGAPSSGGATSTGGAPAGTGGAGTGGAPQAPLSTLWNVQIQATSWTCLGQMALTVQPNGSASGSWTCAETSSGCTYRQIYVTPGPCLSFSGPAVGQFFSDYSVNLQLATDATHGIVVTGTLGADRIIGTAMFADANFPFTAVLR